MVLPPTEVAFLSGVSGGLDLRLAARLFLPVRAAAVVAAGGRGDRGNLPMCAECGC